MHSKLHHRTRCSPCGDRTGRCPQGSSNPRYRLERAASWATRRWGLGSPRGSGIVAAAIRTPSGEYGAWRFDRQGREMHLIRPAVAGALVTAMTVGTYQVASAGSTRTATQPSSFSATAQSLQGEIQDLGNVDLATVSISDVKSTYRRFADLIKQLQREAPRTLKNRSTGSATSTTRSRTETSSSTSRAWSRSGGSPGTSSGPARTSPGCSHTSRTSAASPSRPRRRRDERTIHAGVIRSSLGR